MPSHKPKWEADSLGLPAQLTDDTVLVDGQAATINSTLQSNCAKSGSGPRDSIVCCNYGLIRTSELQLLMQRAKADDDTSAYVQESTICVALRTQYIGVVLIVTFIAHSALPLRCLRGSHVRN